MEVIKNDYVRLTTVDVDQFTYVTNFNICGWGNIFTKEISNMVQLRILIYPHYVNKRIINLQKLWKLECKLFHRDERYIQIGINIMSLPELMSCNVSSVRYDFKKVIKRNKCYGFNLRYNTSDYYLGENIYILSGSKY